MDEKKKHILKTVGDLLVKHGIKSVTMDEIAHSLGISKKTLYQHFKDKENMVSQVIDYYLEHHSDNCTVLLTENPIDQFLNLRLKIAKMLQKLNSNIEFDLKRTYPKQHEKIVLYKQKRIYNDTIANLKQGITSGFYRADLDMDFTARLILGRYLHTLNPENRIFTEKELMSIQLFDKLNDYHLHAICTSKGIEYYKTQINKVCNE